MGSGASMPKKVKFTYFDVRGRGEPIRMIMAVGGIQFEDKRLGLPPPVGTSDEWPKLKPSTPWGSIPVLEMDGRVYGQSVSIGRHVARVTNMAGSPGYEQARLDAIVDACVDIFNRWAPWAFEQEETKKEEKRKAFDNTTGQLVPKLEHFLGDCNYFGGSKVSWADLWFFSVMEQCVKSGSGAQLENSTKLSALYDRIRNIPRMKKYLSQRPETPF